MQGKKKKKSIYDFPFIPARHTFACLGDLFKLLPRLKPVSVIQTYDGKKTTGGEHAEVLSTHSFCMRLVESGPEEFRMYVQTLNRWKIGSLKEVCLLGWLVS